MSTRRHILKRGALLTASSLCPPALVKAAASVSVHRLSEKVVMMQGPDANVLVADSREGLLMVDGGHADWAAALHDAVSQEFPGRSIHALFNTHWHPEQTGSNQRLGEQGVQIIAHENTGLWLGTEIWQRWSDTVFPPLPAVALPTRIIEDSSTLQLAEHHVHLHFLWKAHTDGDLAVFFEEENVLACGGLIANGSWPVIDWWTGGFTGGMLDGLTALLTVPDDDTVIIPASGPVMTKADLLRHNAMYVTVFARLHELFLQSYSLEEILAEKPAAEFEDEMGDATAFLTLAFQSLLGHLRDPQNFRLLNLP